jgi:hypothetical protein
MCKVNSASFVKKKMSGWRIGLGRHGSYWRYLFDANMAIYTLKELDISLVIDIIIFTYSHGRFTTVETIPSAPSRYVESPPSRRPARGLPGQRFLRSGRFAAGQVRDAAAGGGGQATGQQDGKRFWLLASVVLSSAERISGNWSCWSVAPQTRTAIRTQADARVDAVCDTTPARRTGDLHSSTGRPNRTTLWRVGSPSQYRPSTTASKKTSMRPEPAEIHSADGRLVAAYEELRSQAIQGWQRGPGLALMMARGFRSWMEACSQLFAIQCSRMQVADRPEQSIPSGLRGEIVLLLASMMLHRVSKGVA